MSGSFRPGDFELPWPYFGAIYDAAEQEAVDRVLRDTAAGGRALDRRSPEIPEFEERFASYIGVKHAVAVASGGAALELATRLLGVGPGDEVVASALTFKATVLPVAIAGALPVPADIDPVTLNVNAAGIAERITSRTKTIYVVDYAGLPLDWDPIREIAARHGLPILNDAAHAIGAARGSTRVGAWADVSVFSFQSQKNMTTLGEGGMIVTNDDRLADRARALRNYDADEQPGGNYRISPTQAAVGLVQLAKLDAVNERRREVARRLADGLRTTEEGARRGPDATAGAAGPRGAGTPGLTLPHDPPGVTHVRHLFPCLLAGAAKDGYRERLMARLADEYRVTTAVMYAPWYRMPVFAKLVGDAYPCPVNDRIARDLINLPIHPAHSPEQTAYLAWAVREAIERQT